MNILFVRMSYVGDILHATPAARWIKEHYPEAKLHWIVTPTMAEILRHNPYVDEIIEWERDAYEAHSKKIHIPTMWRMWWELREKIKPYKFDVAVDVQGRLITGLVLLASGAPIRLGLGGTKELNWLFTNFKSEANQDHVIKRYLQVAQLLPKALEKHGFSAVSLGVSQSDGIDLQMVLNLSESEIAWAQAEVDTYFNKLVHDSNILSPEVAIPTTQTQSRRARIAIVPGASWASKEWPIYHWTSLVRALLPEMDIVYVGGPKEAREFSPQLPQGEHVYDMMGKTTIRESAALIKACDIVVSGDTGSLYMATAEMVPSVSLFGPTKPQQWGPITGSYHVLQQSDMDCLGCRKRKCPKGHHNCMNELTPERVAQVIRELVTRTI